MGGHSEIFNFRGVMKQSAVRFVLSEVTVFLARLQGKLAASARKALPT